MSEPIAQAVYVSLGLALLTAGFGVFVERHFVSRWTIFFNCFGVASLALALNTSQTLEFILLIIYAIIGGVLVFSKKKFKGKNYVKHLFGSKIYGSIALAYAFNDLDGSSIAKQYLIFLESSGFPKIFDNYLLAFSWMVIVTSVLVASGIVLVWLHFNPKKKKSR
jgi:hypothetical protein